jgi:hypothetical protein
MVLKYSVKFRAFHKDIGTVSGSRAFDPAIPKQSFTFGKNQFFAEVDFENKPTGGLVVSFKSFYRAGWFSIPLFNQQLSVFDATVPAVIYNDHGVKLEIA